MEKVATINGKPATDANRGDLPPSVSHGEFGSLLARIFDPQTSAEFHWDRWDKLDGRRMYVFSCRVPKSSGYVVQDSKGSAIVAFKGLVYADFETKAVMRIEMQCVGFPFASSYRALELKLNYKPAQVAEREFVLPSDFEETYGRSNDNGSEVTTIKAQYERYQRFAADTEIQFTGVDSGKQK
jgi:hypothetical protein